MRIALLGTRGPGFYGGFETCVAEIAPRLAALGHHVTVYARRSSVRDDRFELPDLEVVVLPSVPTKHLDTITHSAVSTAHLLRRRPDAVIVFGVGNSPFAWVCRRLLRIPTVLNVDGLDRTRAKWGRFARWYLSLAERLSPSATHELVTDARTIESYYAERYGVTSHFVPYGAPDGPVPETDELARHGLEPGSYVLYVSRLEPENHPETAIEAHRLAGIEVPLVVVGGSAYDPGYETQLHRMAGPRVIFTGFVFGPGYAQLQSHAALYLQCTEVGGTHPALVEAMGFGNAVAALDTPEHREVLGEAGRYYSSTDDLASIIRDLLGDAEARKELGARARTSAQERFSWDVVTSTYEDLSRSATAKARGG